MNQEFIRNSPFSGASVRPNILVFVLFVFDKKHSTEERLSIESMKESQLKSETSENNQA